MNLDPSPTAMPLAPAEWTMDFSREGRNQYVAQVKRAGMPMCRLSLMQSDLTEADAHTELADKARQWISEYLGRSILEAAGPANTHGVFTHENCRRTQYTG